MTPHAASCLDTWLSTRLKPEALVWLRAQVAAAKASDDQALFLAFSAAGRHVGHGPLALDAAEQSAARKIHPGWMPENWQVDHAARALLVISFADHDAHHWLTTLERLFATASVEEIVALYQALPILPFPELLRERAVEGLRSNMQSAFTAVALDNPFPADQLDMDSFNQMVLKAFFVGVDIDRIQRLESRANAALTRMLRDFAKERRAAHRPIDARLWKVVGWCVDDESHPDLHHVVLHGSADEQAVARQVLAQL